MREKLSDPESWVDSHGDYLYRYALLRVRDPRQAEDLVQETFLAALHSRRTFSGQSTEKTWLTGILRHKIFDNYRQKRRQPAAADECLDAPEDNEVFDRRGHWKKTSRPSKWGSDPATLFEQKRFWEALHKCLEALPPRTAEAFSMRELEGMESRDIASLLSISANNYWVLLHRARIGLRHCLEKRLALKALKIGS